MAPSTVTYNIKQLENQLGVRLFNTHSKGADPTDDAKALFPLIEAAFKKLSKCNDLLNTKYKGTLKIGTVAFIADFLMAKFYNEFRKKYPKIELKFDDNPKRDYLTQLEENKVDVAIMQFLRRPGAKIKIFKLASRSMSFFTTKKFAMKHNVRREMTVAQFMELPFVCHARTGTVLAKLEKYFGQKLNATVVPSGLTAYGMVMDGQGVGIFFDEYLDAQATDQIVRFKIKRKPSPPPVIHECAYHKKPSALVTLFVKELKRFYAL